MNAAPCNIKTELCKKYPYKIELHAHTSPISACSDIPPRDLVDIYKAAGADGVVITNHAYGWNPGDTCEEWADWYLSDYREAKEYGDKLGFGVYLGMELRFYENANDYLVYGVDEEFINKTWRYLKSGGIREFFNDCRDERRVIVQAHPFRDGMTQADPAVLDGIEVFNLHPNHNSRIGFAARHLSRHPGVMTGGSDYHHPGQDAMIFARFSSLPRDSFDIADILRSGDYLFDISGSIILP